MKAVLFLIWCLAFGLCLLVTTLVLISIFMKYVCFHDWRLVDQFHTKSEHTNVYSCAKCQKSKTRSYQKERHS
jgi:hypothetical protein